MGDFNESPAELRRRRHRNCVPKSLVDELIAVLQDVAIGELPDGQPFLYSCCSDEPEWIKNRDAAIAAIRERE